MVDRKGKMDGNMEITIQLTYDSGLSSTAVSCCHREYFDCPCPEKFDTAAIYKSLNPS